MDCSICNGVTRVLESGTLENRKPRKALKMIARSMIDGGFGNCVLRRRRCKECATEQVTVEVLADDLCELLKGLLTNG